MSIIFLQLSVTVQFLVLIPRDLQILFLEGGFFALLTDWSLLHYCVQSIVAQPVWEESNNSFLDRQVTGKNSKS